MKKRRFLIVDTINEIPSHYQYFLLSERLIKEGNEVIFITDSFKQIPGYLGKIYYWKEKSFFKSIFFFINLIIKYKKFDAVILNFSATKYSFLFYFISKKVILTIQSDFFSKNKIVKFKRSIKYFFCNNLLTVSLYMKKKIQDNYYFISKHKCSYLYNSICFDKYVNQIKLSNKRPDFINLESKKIIFVGGLEDHKGFKELIEFLISTIKYSNIVTIAGEGSLKGLIPKNNYRINYLGKINHSEVFKQLLQHQFLILPSKNEAFGQVIIEAFVMGVIPVVRKNTGASELIKHGVNGFLFDNIEEAFCYINQTSDKELKYIYQNIIKQRNIFDSKFWVESFYQKVLKE